MDPATDESSHTGYRLILRSMLPSSVGLAVYLAVAVLFVVTHILLLSVTGKAYPTALDDVLLAGYANYIIRPLIVVFNSNAFNIATLGLIWGVIGFALYEGLSALVTWYHGWREAKTDIATPTDRALRRHPLEGSFIKHTAWRLLIIVASLLMTIGLLSVLHFCITNQERILSTSSVWSISWRSVLSILLIMGTIHCYVVLLRWYMFRTRLTGEILY